MRRLFALILLAAPLCFFDTGDLSATPDGAPIDALIPPKTEKATFALG